MNFLKQALLFTYFLSFSGLVIAQISPQENALQTTGEFQRVKDLFDQSSAASLIQFESDNIYDFKISWTGVCYDQNKDSRKSNILARTIENKNGLRSIHELFVEPTFTQNRSRKDVLNQFGDNLPQSSRPLAENGMLVAYNLSSPQLFARDFDIHAAELRTAMVDGSPRIYAALKENIKLISTKHSATEDTTFIPRLIEILPKTKAFAYCEFDKQYNYKVTFQSESEGCLPLLQSFLHSQRNAGIAKGILGGVLVGSGATLLGAVTMIDAGHTVESNTVEALVNLIHNVKNPDPLAVTTTLDSTYNYIISKQPNWGSKERLKNLILVANNSFYMCSPNLMRTYIYTPKQLANQILRNELNEETFVK